MEDTSLFPPRFLIVETKRRGEPISSCASHFDSSIVRLFSISFLQILRIFNYSGVQQIFFISRFWIISPLLVRNNRIEIGKQDFNRYTSIRVRRDFPSIKNKRVCLHNERPAGGADYCRGLLAKGPNRSFRYESKEKLSKIRKFVHVDSREIGRNFYY